MFQNEWIRPEGKLHHLMEDKDQFSHSLIKAAEVLETTRQTSMPIINSGLSFQENYPELGQAQSGVRAAIPPSPNFFNQYLGQ